MDYLTQSNCPFSSACIAWSCQVICTVTTHDPDSSVSESNPITCELDTECDCSNRWDRSLDCVCLDGSCISVEAR
jgi:hypothetical protein